MPLVTPDDIAAARRRLDGRVLRTPLLDCPRLSDELGVRIRLKAECLQHTGSFKARGATHALLCRQERGADMPGVATFSAGNHAAAIAFAATRLGLPCVVSMPTGAVSAKIENARRHGAEVVLSDDLVGTCLALAEERGFPILHPFDDLDVIAGQGTTGAEIAEDVAPALVVVPVGGGGLISGIAAALPGVRVVGVEPENSAAMTHGFRAGPLVPLPQRPVSLADGLTAPFAGEHTLAHVRAFVDAVAVIPEGAIAPAWWDLMDASKLLLEPSAAVGLAALRLGLVPTTPGEEVVLVLSGGNTSARHLAALA